MTWHITFPFLSFPYLTYLLSYLLAGPTAKHWPDFASLRHAASVYPLVSHAFWTAHGSPNSFPLATEHAGQNGGRKHLLRCCSHLQHSHSWGRGIPNEMWNALRLGALERVLGALSWKEKQNMWKTGNHVLTQQHCLAPAMSQHWQQRPKDSHVANPCTMVQESPYPKRKFQHKKKQKKNEKTVVQKQSETKESNIFSQVILQWKAKIFGLSKTREPLPLSQKVYPEIRSRNNDSHLKEDQAGWKYMALGFHRVFFWFAISPCQK